MRPTLRLVRGEGARLVLEGASEQGALDVARSCRRPPVKHSRVEGVCVEQLLRDDAQGIDLEAWTLALAPDPWRDLLLASRELVEAVQGVLACDGADVGRGDLVDVVRERLAAVARAAGEVV